MARLDGMTVPLSLRLAVVSPDEASTRQLSAFGAPPSLRLAVAQTKEDGKDRILNALTPTRSD
jgi:hypothetical protein